MPRVTFVGAGSAVFARQLITDILAVDGLEVAEVGGGAAGVVLLLGLGIYVAQLAALGAVAACALAVGINP